jgi:glyceraldehyde 3-phosphate dehydrogenase
VNNIIISAIANDESSKIAIIGVNDDAFSNEYNNILNISQTTNDLAAITKIIFDNFRIEEGFMIAICNSMTAEKVIDGCSRNDCKRDRG